MCVDVLWEIYLELSITKNSVTWFIIFTDQWLCLPESTAVGWRLDDSDRHGPWHDHAVL